MEKKNKKIKKICWRDRRFGEICAIGFVLKETNKIIEIASTHGIHDFLDKNKVCKDSIVFREDLLS